MKLTSLTSVTLALWCGSLRSRRRAAVRPPKPPPRMSTFQAMPWTLAVEPQRAPFAGGASLRLAQAVARERGGDLVALLAQEAGDDQRPGRAGHDLGDVEQERPDEVGDRGRGPRPGVATQ